MSSGASMKVGLADQIIVDSGGAMTPPLFFFYFFGSVPFVIKYILDLEDNRYQKRIMCGITELETNHINTQTAYMGLGSNLGDRAGNLQAALSQMAEMPTISIMRVSSLYETAPVGVTEQPDFLNAVAALETSLPALELLNVFLHLENQIGRVRTFRWGPRVIDLDLLLYGDAQIALPSLAVPHPRLRERAFVLVPLAEIAPELILPGETKTVKQLANYFCGKGNIRRLDVV